MVIISRSGWTLIAILMIFSLFASPVNASQKNQLDIETSPDTYLFKVANMKPGDWAPRVLTIQNRGEQAFTYKSKVAFTNGSKKLYEAFLLTVTDGNNVELFNGKLHEFDGFSPRYLASLHEEDLLFKVTFPYELGNEYQGLAFEAVFQFIIEDDDVPEDNPPGDNPPGEEPPDDNPPGGNPPEEEPPGESPPDNQPPGEQPPNQEPPVDEPPTNQHPDSGQPQPKPSHPIDSNDLTSPPKDGQILPSTATNFFNYLFFGGLLVVGGAVLLILNRRKSHIRMKV